MTKKNEIVIYTTPEGKATFEVNLKKIPFGYLKSRW